MTLYQIFKNDQLVADNVEASKLFGFIPAGSKLISGNTTRMVDKPEGGLEEHHEIRAHYKLHAGGYITIIQKP